MKARRRRGRRCDCCTEAPATQIVTDVRDGWPLAVFSLCASCAAFGVAAAPTMRAHAR